MKEHTHLGLAFTLVILFIAIMLGVILAMMLSAR